MSNIMNLLANSLTHAQMMELLSKTLQSEQFCGWKEREVCDWKRVIGCVVMMLNNFAIFHSFGIPNTRIAIV